MVRDDPAKTGVFDSWEKEKSAGEQAQQRQAAEKEPETESSAVRKIFHETVR